MDHHDQEALTSREREDHWFGHPAYTEKIELPATMDAILERRNGTDEDPEGRFQ